MKNFGINIISTFGKKFSLTYVAYNIANSLLQKGVPISLVNAAIDAEPQYVDKKWSQYMVERVEDLIHPVNLYVMPVSLIGKMMNENPGLLLNKKMHVANLWWEFNKLPNNMAMELMRHDVILTHSDFLANMAALNTHSTYIVNSKLTWPVDSDTLPDRALFNLPNNGTIFLFAFDADSEAGTIDLMTGNGRKNPFYLIDTFQYAFPMHILDAHLAIRATNIDKPQHKDFLKRLLQIAAVDSRIHIIRGDMAFTDVMKLSASCDVYVSLHKAEGLGLGMLEAMALGKPVIATAWSGNMSFMDISSACLVRCRAVELNESYMYWGDKIPSGALWAEPIKEDAIFYMKLLYGNVEYRNSVGQRARMSYEAYQESANLEKWIDELYCHWRTFEFLPKIKGKYSAIIT